MVTCWSRYTLTSFFNVTQYFPFWPFTMKAPCWGTIVIKLFSTINLAKLCWLLSVLKTGKFITGAWLTVSSHVSTRYTTTNRRSKNRLRYTTTNRRRIKYRLRYTTMNRRRSKNRLRDTRRRRAITTKKRRNRRTRVPYTYLTSW